MLKSNLFRKPNRKNVYVRVQLRRKQRQLNQKVRYEQSVAEEASRTGG